TLPVLEPFFGQKDGQTFHPLRHTAPKVVVLSVAGFPDASVFDQLSSWIHFIYGNKTMHVKSLVAEIYRPMAEALTLPYFKDMAANILDATQQAGREIATSMSVSEETMTRIGQPMVEDPGIFLNLGNLMWKACIAKGITPKEFSSKGLIPRPDSIPSYVDLMKLGFNAAAANGLHAKIQFNFSGEIQGSCVLSIIEGAFNGHEGTVNQPELTVNTPFEVWMDIITGQADGQQMFMDQKYTVEGDLELLMQIGQLFGNR
ncbi:MAG: SCP2 sterol-binding domain-containing protein, partial [Deltaproteobacteria bacterium]|nr:SCP2 sterol-binding domain-containing protein [Deltaproteobacteria bacterium]